MGRDDLEPAPLLRLRGFNPRARVGRDIGNRPYMSSSLSVSIHAPAWGATADDFSRNRITMRFNPRARVGRDMVNCLDILDADVSIHAPAWGATDCNWLISQSLTFQSTRPRGARR